MSKYVWCEDSASGFEFWKNIFKVINPEFTVQTKRNNTELRKAASRIEADGNEYYVLIDSSVDNHDVVREVKKLKESVEQKEIHSFEFALLSFQKLEDWVFAKDDELKYKRIDLLRAKDVFVDIQLNSRNQEKLIELKNSLHYSNNYNTEQLSAKLLYDITRNTGFETDKGHLGECFVINCCEMENRQADDICGLDTNRLSSEDKAKQIYQYSILKDVLQLDR